MNELVGAVVVVVSSIICLVAFFIVIGVLFPRRVADVRAIADATPGRALLIGVVNLLFFGVIALASFAIAESSGFGILALPGLVILTAVSLALIVGLTAIAQLVGERIAPTDTTLRQGQIGGLSLTLACLLPFVGWFALLPYVGLLGLGAVIISQTAAWRRPSPKADAPLAEDDFAMSEEIG